MNYTNPMLTEHLPFTFEVYPPKKEDEEKFISVIKEFEDMGFKSVNVTCKPIDLNRTIEIVKLIHQESSLNIIPHLVGNLLSMYDLERVLTLYKDMSITNLFVLGGDLFLPTETERKRFFPYAIDLLKQVKKLDDSFCIGVAAYPEGHFQEPNAIKEMEFLKEKVDAGADYIITQLFFNNQTYFEFLERLKLFGIRIPTVPGITYVKNSSHLKRLAGLSLGTQFPPELLKHVYIDNDTDYGVHWLKEQVRELLDNNIDALHLYTFNEVGPFGEIATHYKV